MPFRLNTSRAILSASFRKFLASAAACSVSRSDSIAAPFGNTGSGVLDDSSIHVSAPPPAPYRPWWACAISRLSLCTTPPLAARSFDNQDLIWQRWLRLPIIFTTVALAFQPPNFPRDTRSPGAAHEPGLCFWELAQVIPG